MDMGKEVEQPELQKDQMWVSEESCGSQEKGRLCVLSIHQGQNGADLVIPGPLEDGVSESDDFPCQDIR